MNQKDEIRSNLIRSYNKHALERDKDTTQEWKITERSRFLSLLQRENRKSLLEIGAGTGRDSKFFQDQGLKTTCVDLSPAMVEICKQKGVDAHAMDMLDINYPDNSFDAIFCLNSLLHLTKTEFPIVLAKISSLLKTDGIVYLGLYGGFDFEGIYEDDFYRPKRFFSFFSDEQLKLEVSKFLNIISFDRIIVEKNNHLHFQSVILRKKL